MSTVALYREQLDTFGRQTDGLLAEWRKGIPVVEECCDYEDWISLGLTLLEAFEQGHAAWRRRVFRGTCPPSEAVSAGWKELFGIWVEVARRGALEGRRLAALHPVDRLEEFAGAAARIDTLLATWRTPERSILPGMRDASLSPRAADALLKAEEAAGQASKKPPVPSPLPEASESDFFADLTG